MAVAREREPAPASLPSAGLFLPLLSMPRPGIGRVHQRFVESDNKPVSGIETASLNCLTVSGRTTTLGFARAAVFRQSDVMEFRCPLFLQKQ
jgi:hypothetical protein